MATTSIEFTAGLEETTVDGWVYGEDGDGKFGAGDFGVAVRGLRVFFRGFVGHDTAMQMLETPSMEAARKEGGDHHVTAVTEDGQVVHLYPGLSNITISTPNLVEPIE